ncbi:MAG TPA: D-glycerate dehydrogenase [Ilumatobacter sp.]|nr:D-glycerate dehydrogenase [Ilumatobacter sp.]
MARIVVTGRVPAPALELLQVAGDTWMWEHPDPIPRDRLLAELGDAEALLTVFAPADQAVLDAAPRLRVVANVAVGYDNVDVAACTARGIRVTNTPGVLTDATADIAFGLLLSATRRLGEAERLLRSGATFVWGFETLLGTGLQGRQLGVVGMGDIGAAIARRARAFGMSVAYSNRRAVAPAIEAELGARLLPLDELLATSDVVSLNCPYTPETHHLIDAAALARMKPTAFLVNTARGKVVDEEALVEALRTGVIAGAGLDVFEHEPKVHPGLLELENVALAPHVGSATVETRTAMAVLAARNAVAVLAGEEPPTPVN